MRSDLPDDQSWRAVRARAWDGYGLFLGIAAWIAFLFWIVKLVLVSWLV